MKLYMLFAVLGVAGLTPMFLLFLWQRRHADPLEAFAAAVLADLAALPVSDPGARPCANVDARVDVQPDAVRDSSVTQRDLSWRPTG